MSTTSIDQILQIAPSARKAESPPNGPEADRGRFQEQLQRATPTTEKKPTEPTTTEQSPENLDTETTVQADSEQETSLENGEPQLDTSEVEATVEPATEVIAELLSSDEISLSTDAVLASEETDLIESESDLNIETAVEATTEVQQVVQPSIQLDQHAENLAETVEEHVVTEPVSQQSTSSEEKQEEAPAPTTEELIDTAGASQSLSSALRGNAPQETAVTDTDQPQTENLPTVKAVTQTNGNNESSLNQQFSDEDNSQHSQEHSSQTSELSEELKAETKDVSHAQSSSELLNKLEKITPDTSTVVNEAETTVAPNTPAPEVHTTPHQESSVVDRPAGLTTNDVVAGTEVESQSDNNAIPTADRARFVQRVAGAIRSAKDQDGLIQLKLSPPELGSLRIEITVKQGALTAQLETETSAARNVILDNLPALRERLAEQEIRIEKFDVDVRDEGGQQQEFTGTEERRSNQTASRKNASTSTNQTTHQEEVSPSLTTNIPSNEVVDGLDVMI